MLEKSVAQELQDRGAKLKEIEADAKRLADDYQVKKQEIEDLKKQMETMTAAKVEADKVMEALKAEKEAGLAEMKKLDEKIKELQAKLELTPAAQVSDGVPVGTVKDGQASESDLVDHAAVLEKLSGAEKIKYYREHEEAINKKSGGK